MANKLVLKRSSVAAKVPLSTDLDVGELAVNLTDKKLFTKDAGGTVIELGGSSGGGGGIAWQSVQTANFIAAAGNAYPVNTTSGAITVTLPASPTAGQIITVLDYAGTAATNNIIVSPNGNKLQGSTYNAIISTNRQSYNFVYADVTQGWLSYAQEYNALTQSAPPPSGDPYWTSVSLLTNSANELSFADASTNNFAITNTGGVKPSLFTPFAGGVGGSQYFNGSSSLSGSSNSALSAGSGAFTYETWFYVNSFPLTATLLDTGNTYGALQIGRRDTGTEWGVARSYVAWVLTSSTLPTTSQWNHMVVVRNGSNNMSLFLNGTRVATTSTPYTFAQNGFNIGISCQGNLSNTRYVVGTAIYDPTQTTITVPTAPLTAVSGTSLLINGTNQNTFDNATFYDQSANSFAITKSGSPVYSGLSPFGNAYVGSTYLDGSSYLTFPNSTALQLGTGDFTFEGWFYASSLSGSDSIVYSSGSSGFGCILRSNAIVTFQSFVAYNNSFSTTLSNNTWYHIAVVRNSGTMTCYLNGTSLGSGSNTTNYVQSTGGAIGADETGGSKFTGYISNLRVVKGTAVYTANFTPSTTPLPTTANTSLLLGCDTGAFYDLSNTGNPISQGGSPVVTTQVSPFASVTESYYFDGSSYLVEPSTASVINFGSADYTVEYWIYLTGSGSFGYDQVIGADTVTDNSIGFGFLGSSNQIYATSLSVGYGTGTNCPTNSWNHIAWVRQGTTVKMYLNGVLSSTLSISNSYSGTGCKISSNSYPLQVSYLSNLRITKGVARYTANFTPPTAPFPTSA